MLQNTYFVCYFWAKIFICAIFHAYCVGVDVGVDVGMWVLVVWFAWWALFILWFLIFLILIVPVVYFAPKAR